MAARQPADQHGDAPIALLGAGSLGRLWGACLPAGSACFLPRSPGSAELEHRYQLITPDGERQNCTVPVRELAQWRPSALLVLTKAGDTPTALASHANDLPSSVPIVLFQNGLGSHDRIVQDWPDRPILAAVTTEGANRPDPHTLVHAGRGETWIGGLNEAGCACTDAVAKLLGAGTLVLHSESDIRWRLWNKLVVNAGINAFTAILDCRNGDILESDYFLTHIGDLCEEIAQVMATEMRDALTSEQVKDRICAVAKSTAANTSSMRSDRQRGRKTEIDVINGYLVQAGARAGIATPVNRMLCQAVKDLTEHPTNSR